MFSLHVCPQFQLCNFLCIFLSAKEGSGNFPTQLFLHCSIMSDNIMQWCRCGLCTVGSNSDDIYCLSYLLTHIDATTQYLISAYPQHAVTKENYVLVFKVSFDVLQNVKIIVPLYDIQEVYMNQGVWWRIHELRITFLVFVWQVDILLIWYLLRTKTPPMNANRMLL